MTHDGKIDIAVGMSAKSKTWKNQTFSWSEFVQKISKEHKTRETFKEFIRATRAEQFKIKDVGGYVGGYLRNGRRKPENVVHRQLLTLDVDFATAEFWEDFVLQFENAAVLHGTHKHSAESPRLRLLMPLDREVSADEYVAISRKIAGYLDIELFDNTTFEVNRLMFWPSSPVDTEYYFKSQDGPFLNADDILNSYIDWTDSSLWPTAEAQIDKVRAAAEKQEDPQLKRGIVGAFCRAYTITEAIDAFLSEEYEESAIENRYTYTKGTTAAGLILYDDKFAYSHHGTDPAGGNLCNSFDLVRLHVYGHLDMGSESGKGTKSFKAMEEVARTDKKVKRVIAAESLASAKYDFIEPLEIEQEDIEYMQELEVDNKGKYLSTATNINIIFANDPRIKGLFRYNEFDGKKYIFDSLPWRKIKKPEPVKNVDFSGIRNYMETIYSITGNSKIDDALALEFEKYTYHPVREYLENLEWDGTERIDKLLIEYFGADDIEYTREAMRKFLTAGVARIFSPGIKYDLVLTLVGHQGSYKSTFAKKLGRQWFSDSFNTVHGKEALEQIQGAWVIEMAELSGLRKAEVEATKHFISKQEDTFRPAYGRTSETYPRQCVFIATTNNKDFLKDPSGNRRFIPVDVNPHLVTKSVKDDLTEQEVGQIWAEAVELYRNGENLYMSPQAEAQAKIEQKKHSSTDERLGLIEEYLNRKLPEDWDQRSIMERRLYLEDPLSAHGDADRDFVCVAEVWTECLGKPREDMSRYNTREVNDMLRSLDGWEQMKSPRNFPLYGKQKYYVRVLT